MSRAGPVFKKVRTRPCVWELFQGPFSADPGPAKKAKAQKGGGGRFRYRGFSPVIAGAGLDLTEAPSIDNACYIIIFIIQGINLKNTLKGLDIKPSQVIQPSTTSTAVTKTARPGTKTVTGANTFHGVKGNFLRQMGGIDLKGLEIRAEGRAWKRQLRCPSYRGYTKTFLGTTNKTSRKKERSERDSFAQSITWYKYGLSTTNQSKFCSTL